MCTSCDDTREALEANDRYWEDKLDALQQRLAAAEKVVEAAKEMMRVTHKGAKYATDPETCSNPVCTALAAYDAERKEGK